MFSGYSRDHCSGGMRFTFTSVRQGRHFIGIVSQCAMQNHTRMIYIHITRNVKMIEKKYYNNTHVKNLTDPF